MCLGMCFLGSNFFGTLSASWTSWKSIFFAILGKFPFIMFLCFQISFSILVLPLPLLDSYDSHAGTFKVVLEVPKPFLIFLNSCFFLLFWLNVYFCLLVQIVNLSPSFLPFIVGSLYISLHFTFHSLHFFLYFATILNNFCQHPDYQCFELCISDRLAISSWLSCIFSGALICSFIWAMCFGLSMPITL